MDKLKNFIDTNREAFEDDLLPEGHFERFEQKLAVPRKSRATLYSLCAFSAAACLRGERGDRGTSSLLQYADE